MFNYVSQYNIILPDIFKVKNTIKRIKVIHQFSHLMFRSFLTFDDLKLLCPKKMRAQCDDREKLKVCMKKTLFIFVSITDKIQVV